MKDSHIAEVVKRAMRLSPGEGDMFRLSGKVNVNYDRQQEGISLTVFFPAQFRTVYKFVRFFPGHQNRDANAALLAVALYLLTEAEGVV